MITRIDLPGLIERGRDTAITLDVYTDAGVQQTAGAATLTIYDGSEEVVSAAAATGLGPPATYTVTAATTTARSLSPDWLAVWTMTIAGADYVFQQPLMLVRRRLYPVITDTDLTDRHSDLDSLRDTAQMATFEPFRSAAWSRIQRMLIRKGHRPALVLDVWSLHDLHVYETLADLFMDFGSTLGDQRYTELAQDYRERARAEWGEMDFRYDEDEDGTIDSSDHRSASPVVYLSAPKWGAPWRS